LFYLVAFARKSRLAEKSRTAPKKGTKTHAAFASTDQRETIVPENLNRAVRDNV
jgi:hypothetical protein